MAVRHVNRIFMLPLPSSVRFVLLALGRYADDNDSCYPGIAKLSEMTGYCEKTVIRSIKVLSSLGIIDVIKNPKGLNNIYTLYVGGDIKAWYEYLESKIGEIQDLNKVNQSTSITSKSIYNNSYNSEYDTSGYNEVWVAGDKSPACQDPENQKPIPGEDIKNIPPGRRKPLYLKLWEESVHKYFKGLKVKVNGVDKWELESFYHHYSKELPIYEFIEYIISNWSRLHHAVSIKKFDWHAKHFPNVPQISYLAMYADIAMELFWDSKNSVSV